MIGGVECREMDGSLPVGLTLSFRRFGNSRNMEVPSGTKTNRLWPGKCHEHFSFRTTNRYFPPSASASHGQERRSYAFVTYPLRIHLPLEFTPEAWAILEERWSNPSPELFVCSWCGRDDRPRGGGSGVGGPHRILRWLRDL
jgi:hypothetical protein